MAIKKTFKIDCIPGFRYEVNLPSGFSRIIEYKGKADIYLNNKWVTWDNLYFKKEPNILENIESFFFILNSYMPYCSSNDFEYLKELNRSQLAKDFFNHISGQTIDSAYTVGMSIYWGIHFRNDYENGTHTDIKLFANTYYDSTDKITYIRSYSYVYECTTGYSPYPNIRKTLSLKEGHGLIALLRLSILCMIHDNQFAGDIRVVNGHYAYKENLLELSREYKFI